MARRRIYDTPAWRALRPAILERDNYRCQIAGRRCKGTATEVDHIVPIVAGGAPYDHRNLRAVCKPCNVARVSAERAEHGWQRSHTKITLVWGPPGAGKSTYVAQHRRPDDLVVDFDTIAESLGSGTSHGHSEALVEAAAVARNAILRKLRRGELSAEQAWIISANPKATDMFPHHVAVLIDPGRDEVLRQAVNAGRPELWHRLIDRWYASSHPVVGGRRVW